MDSSTLDTVSYDIFVRRVKEEFQRSQGRPPLQPEMIDIQCREKWKKVSNRSKKRLVDAEVGVDQDEKVKVRNPRQQKAKIKKEVAHFKASSKSTVTNSVKEAHVDMVDVMDNVDLGGTLKTITEETKSAMSNSVDKPENVDNTENEDNSKDLDTTRKENHVDLENSADMEGELEAQSTVDSINTNMEGETDVNKANPEDTMAVDVNLKKP